MNYVGFLCLGLGILSLVMTMICGLLAFASHEKRVKTTATRAAVMLSPVAFLLLTVGLKLSFTILFPTE